MPSPIIVRVISTLFRGGNISGVTLVGPIPVTGNLTATGQIQAATLVSTGALTVGNGLTVSAGGISVIGSISSTQLLTVNMGVVNQTGLAVSGVVMNVLSASIARFTATYLGGTASPGLLVSVVDTASAGASLLTLEAGGAGTTIMANVSTLGDLYLNGKFGCNNTTPQAKVASGGAMAAYVTGGFGLDSDVNMHALYTLVKNIRTALVANGIMS